MDKKNRINVNSSSLVGLKAELYRKQEEFKKERLQRLSSSSTPSTKPKTSSIWSKKKDRKRAAGDLPSRPEKDAEQREKERLEMERARKMLEAKTKLYEQMTSGNEMPDEQTNNLFLVDFERKQLNKATGAGSHTGDPGSSGKGQEDEDPLAPDSEIPPASNPDEEWVDYTDSLGRSRRCMRKDLPGLVEMDKKLNPDKFKSDPAPEGDVDGDLPELLSDDMHRERMRRKWEQEQQDLLDRGQSSIHYQNVRFDEVRTHGAAYFEFAKDEGTREEQMSTLKHLRDETVNQRMKREELKAKRKAALAARLEKVRQRKKIKTGATGNADEEGADGATNQGTDSVIEQGAGAVPGVSGTRAEESLDPNWQRTLRLVEAAKKEAKKEDREWDVAKEPKSWADQRAKVRSERLTEFAPPTDYTPSAARRKGGKKWRHAGEKGANQDSDLRKPTYSNHATETEGLADKDPVDQAKFVGGGVEGFGGRMSDDLDRGDVDQLAVSGATGPHVGNQGQRNSVSATLTSSAHLGISASSSQSAMGQRPDHIQGSLPVGGVGVGMATSSGQGRALIRGVTPNAAVSAQSRAQPPGLVRTETSKPIKFSIGLGGGREGVRELPRTSAASCFDDDDDDKIKKGIQILRGHTS